VITSLRKFLRELGTIKFCFHPPPQSDIVVFDESHIKMISNYILAGHSYFIYNMRPEKIYISLSVIYCFLKSLLISDWNAVRVSKKRLQTVLQQLIYSYRMGCFIVIKPRVVVTAVDNSGCFHWLSQNYKDAAFFAIQNGHRTNIQLTEGRTKQYLTNFFCFGDYERDRYLRFGHVIEKSYPMGSLKLGVYNDFYRDGKSDMEEKYDLSIVSQYRRQIHQVSYAPLLVKALTSMHELLSRFIKENCLKVALIMCSNGDADEIELHRNIYNDNIDYISNDKTAFTSYRIINKSGIVVGFNSTLILEAFGIGRKVLLIDSSGTDDFTDYDPIILLKNPSYSELENRLNGLLVEPYEDYRRRTKEYASYVMNYNPDCPPHEYIRKKIAGYL
jgi:surface carbohydrate biosynthesis protein